jgi:SAM-dependent methyltransferase
VGEPHTSAASLGEIPERSRGRATEGLERVRALAAAHEIELASVEAIRGIAASAPGEVGARAALWNDLGVLRHQRGDSATARACLREALRLEPGSALAAGNLAGLEAIGPAPRASADAHVVRGAENANPWVREALEAAGRRPGLRGRRVLEVGGVVPAELLAETGAASWVACDPTAENESEAVRHAVRKADARALPFPDAHFDVAFSSCAFEHFHELDRALAEIARVLRPGGALFTQFAPIWSSGLGHHLFLETETRGRVTFNDRLLPDWGHLLLERHELEGFLAVALGPADATRALRAVFDSPYLNRWFEADFTRAFAAAPLVLAERSRWGNPCPPTRALARELARRHPHGGDFGVPGIRALLVKP